MRKIIYLLAIVLGIGSLLSSCQELTDPSDFAQPTKVALHINQITYQDWDGKTKDLTEKNSPLVMNFRDSTTGTTYWKQEVSCTNGKWILPSDILDKNITICSAYTPSNADFIGDEMGWIRLSTQYIQNPEEQDNLVGAAQIGEDNGITLHLKHALARFRFLISVDADYAEDSIYAKAIYIRQNPDKKILPTSAYYSLMGKISMTENFADIVSEPGIMINKKEEKEVIVYTAPATASGQVQVEIYPNTGNLADLDINAEKLKSGTTTTVTLVYGKDGLKVQKVE